MVQTVDDNKNSFKKGFSIVEILVAIVIFSLALLGLLSTILTVYKMDVKNSLRDMANRILMEQLEGVQELGYSGVNSTLNNGTSGCRDALLTGKNVVERPLRNTIYRFGKFYSISDNPAIGIKKVTVEVCWFYRGKFYSLNGTTIVR
jgi:type IV pilus assembly protein PilV